MEVDVIGEDLSSEIPKRPGVVNFDVGTRSQNRAVPGGLGFAPDVVGVYAGDVENYVGGRRSVLEDELRSGPENCSGDVEDVLASTVQRML